MNEWISYVAITLFAALLYIFVSILGKLKRLKNYDATVWGGDIDKFVSEDLNKLANEVIVFTGSSSIKYWKTLEADMAPLPIINRGFGGSRIPDVLYYFEDVVLPYNPKAVVFYAGENDIAGFPMVKGEDAETVFANFKKFCELTAHISEDIPIYFVSIKPPKRRKKYWSEMQKANQLIKEYCDDKDQLNYIDITDVMMRDGEINYSLFKWDGIHLNAEGYKLWTSVLKPVLIEKFG